MSKDTRLLLEIVILTNFCYRSRKPSETSVSDPFATVNTPGSSEQPGLNQPNASASRLSTSSASSASAISTMIPANKGSKRYQLDSVFKVWFDNQLKIEHQVFSKTDDNYKLDTPGHIYHLELQSSISLAPKSTSSDSASGDQVNDITAGMKKVDVSEPLNQAADLQETFLLQPESAATLAAPVPQPIAASFAHPEPKEAQFVQSDKIEWVYVDPSGNEQGPFNGDIMQEWLTAGYLNMDLKIRRKEESTYYSLREYCDRVGNYVQPFKIPLLDLTAVPPPPNLQPMQSHLAMSSNDIGVLKDNMLQSGAQLPQLFSAHQAPLHDVLSQQQLQQQQQPQLALLSQFFLQGNGGLGGSSIRLNSSLNPQGNLFTPDFINNDPFNTATIPQQQTSSFSNQFGYDHMGSGFGMNNLSHSSLSHINSMPSLLQQQIHQQQPVLSRTNSGWGMDLNSASGTPVAVASSLNQINQPAPLSPWLSGVQSLSRVGSPFVPTLTLKDDTVLNIHSSVTDILGNVDEDTTSIANPVQTSTIISSHPTQVIELGPPEPSIIEEVVAPSRTEEAPVINETKQVEEKETPQNIEPKYSESPVYNEPLLGSLPAKTGFASESNATGEFETFASKDKNASTDSLKAVPSAQPKLAPWAKVTTKVAEPLSLKEIQKLEAEKLEKQKQEQKTEQPKLWQLEEKLDEIPSAVPLGWANASASKPTKTLAEIQREEADARAKASRAAASGSSSGTPILSKASLASTLAAVPKDDGGAWTTISKKQPVKKPSTTSLYTTPTTNKINPQMLRSASATKNISSGINTVSIKEEFLIWARSAMTNLYPSANRDEMLDLFVALPNGAESSQLIADTIYSSSATMDGRRYAQEFMKRRQKVEAQIGNADDYSWTEAIILSADKVATVDEDGWSTSTKKKGGRRK